MNENINPDAMEQQTTSQNEPVEELQSEVVDFSGKSLAELSDLFQKFATSEDRLQRAKEAEALKSAFYRTLLHEREKLQEGMQDIFTEVEENFKALYSAFKKEKAAFNRQMEEQREANLSLKQNVIADLKALLEKDEDVSATMPSFREIQNRWREIGPVPVHNVNDINKTYQLYVEQFYDKLKINRELRDLDFKKNLEAKSQLCEKAEELSVSEDVINAFRELQKLHDSWKDLGPVAKQYRDEIWERFKAATAIINKKYQAYFEGMKVEQEANLKAKQSLCEKIETIAGQDITDSKLWNTLSREIENIQAEWKTLGYATRKENQKVYDRFRAACDKFYERKRTFYGEFKDGLENNLRKKEELCELAEQLKSSTEWKEATDKFLDLQKKWKEIGAVPRKKSEAVWARFRAACDEFFNEKEKNFKPAENDYYANLKAKKRVIEKISEYKSSGNETEDSEAMNALIAEFNSFGFVPFKEKEKIAAAFKEALEKAFPGKSRGVGKTRGSRNQKPAESEKDKLMAKYRTLEQEIATKENNILFFTSGKGNQLVDMMRQSIEDAKKELIELEEKIRSMEENAQ